MSAIATAYHAHERKWDGVISVVLGLFLWQIVDATLVHNPLVLVGPKSIAEAFLKLLARGEILRNVYATFVEFILGYGVGVVVGIAFGVVMALSRTARDILSPWVTIAYNAPVILLAPIFITALGVGIVSKIAIVFISAVFPVLFNTYTGMTTVDGRLVEAVRAFGGTPKQIFFKVTLPSSIPLIMTGLRLSVGRALVGAIVSEFFGSRAGLGHLITAASEAFRTADAFVGVVLLAIGGYLAFELLKYAERKIAPWYAYKV
ncbi:MAG TPA: ABC transporter permease [Candidatus Binatia bacterium]|nr:ABC transporter permease [Candidatus Binatia bacterium]